MKKLIEKLEELKYKKSPFNSTDTETLLLIASILLVIAAKEKK